MAIIRRGPTKRALGAMETRSRVLESALSLFEEYDFDKVTIEDITRQAGVSKGTFYTYFDNKEAVLVERFRAIDDCYKETIDNLPPDATALERAQAIIHTLVDYCQNVCGRSFMRVIYMNQISLSNKTRILDNSDRLISKILHECATLGIASGEFRSDLPAEEIQYFLARTIRSIMYEWCLVGDEEHYDLQKQADQYCALVLPVILNESKQSET